MTRGFEDTKTIRIRNGSSAHDFVFRSERSSETSIAVSVRLEGMPEETANLVRNETKTLKFRKGIYSFELDANWDGGTHVEFTGELTLSGVGEAELFGLPILRVS